eukprot:sb/3470301/
MGHGRLGVLYTSAVLCLAAPTRSELTQKSKLGLALPDRKDLGSLMRTVNITDIKYAMLYFLLPHRHTSIPRLIMVRLTSPVNHLLTSYLDILLLLNHFKVTLQKTTSGSLGLVIVGGRSSRLGDIGVFVKSVVDGSPAAYSGKLQPWDQILKVNSLNLEGLTLEETLSALKRESSSVTLTVLPTDIATQHLQASLKSAPSESNILMVR